MDTILKKRLSQLFLFPFENGCFWLVDLKDINSEELEKAKPFLSLQDLRKSSQFVFEKDRSRHTLVYAIIKLLIGKLISQAPNKIQLLRTKFGKPYLQESSLYFNLSYTENYAFFSSHPFRSIGVDIEKVDARINLLDSADSFLSPYEKKWLFNTLNPLETAFTLWCAKEAFLKATGTGFSVKSLPILIDVPSYTCVFNHFKVKDRSNASYLHNTNKNNENSSFDKSDIYVYNNILAKHKLAVCII